MKFFPLRYMMNISRPRLISISSDTTNPTLFSSANSLSSGMITDRCQPVASMSSLKTMYRRPGVVSGGVTMFEPEGELIEK